MYLLRFERQQNTIVYHLPLLRLLLQSELTIWVALDILNILIVSGWNVNGMQFMWHYNGVETIQSPFSLEHTQSQNQ